jgi:hypothetical protein
MSITLCLVQMQAKTRSGTLTLPRYGISIPLLFHFWLNIYTAVKVFMSNSLAPYILPKETIAQLNTVLLITLIDTIAENLRRAKKFQGTLSITSNSRWHSNITHVWIFWPFTCLYKVSLILTNFSYGLASFTKINTDNISEEHYDDCGFPCGIWGFN